MLVERMNSVLKKITVVSENCDVVKHHNLDHQIRYVKIDYNNSRYEHIHYKSFFDNLGIKKIGGDKNVSRKN